MPVRLDWFVYGPSATGSPAFGLAEGVSLPQASLWRGLVSLYAPDAEPAYGLFAGPDDRFAFVRVQQQAGTPTPRWTFLLLPRTLLIALTGDLGVLRQQADTAAEVPVSPAVAPVELPDPAPWPLHDRQAAVEGLLAARDGRIEDVWSLLGMALHERGLMIYGAPDSGAQRLRLVQALAALVPPSARALLTFTTGRAPEVPSNTRIAFAGRDVTTGRWIADLAAEGSLPTGAQSSAWVQWMQSRWSGSLAALLAEVEAIDRLLQPYLDGRPIDAVLEAASARAILDQRVASGEPVSPEILRQALTELPPEGELSERYYARLLDHALTARDNDSALLVARAMDTDPALDQTLAERLSGALADEPDAVYAFIRARVASGEPPEARWMERLRSAASAALTVALADGDNEIVRSWIRLLAREPLSYDLAPVLSQSLRDALPLGRAHPELARSMLVVAVKRDPEAMNALLADEAFAAAIPEDLRRMLCAGELDDLGAASVYGVELLLAALARAVTRRQAGLFTPTSIETLWQWAFGSQTVQIAEPFGALQTLQRLIEDPGWLPREAQVALLAEALRDGHDELFQKATYALTANPNTEADRADWLSEAVIQSERGPGETAVLLGALSSAGLLPEDDALDVSVRVLDAGGWSVELLPLAGRVARAAAQGLPIERDLLWRLLDHARAARDEGIGRETLRRVTSEIEAETDDEPLTHMLATTLDLTRWSVPLSASVLQWWRGYARGLSTARLARLERAFESQRDLMAARAIAASLLAFRRMLGKRTLAQLAQDAAIALSLLQSLDEAWESAGRRDDLFDADVMRAELEARRSEMAETDTRLLANELSALAQLIGELGDSRSRQALLRRDDTDQLLARGETQPHSAVDALKWISGYLSGAQRASDEG